MIAPQKMFKPVVRPSRSGKRLAAALLNLTQPRVKPLRPVPAWQGWLLAAWVTVVAACYFSMLAGLWR